MLQKFLMRKLFLILMFLCLSLNLFAAADREIIFDIGQLKSLSTTPANPGAGKIKLYHKDGGIKVLDENGSESSVGSSSSTDTLAVFAGEESLSLWAKGNSAIVMGGGVFNGAFSKETIDPLNGSATYKFIQSSTSVNDYMCTPARPVKRGFKGPTVFVGTPFNYDGSSGDIQVSVYDVTNSVVLTTFSVVTFPSSSSSSTQMMSGVFPQSTNSYRVCYQVKSANSGKVFSYGPIVSTKSLAVFGSINSYNLTSYKEFTPNFSGIGTPSLVKAFWRQNGDHLEVYGRATSGTVANSGFTIGFSSLGLKIDTAKVVADNTKGQIKGAFARDAVDAVSFNVGFSSAYVDSVYVAEGGALGGLRDSDGSAIINSNEKFSFYFSVPILGWTAESSAIASPTQQISSDTMNFAFKATAIIDSDPVGTYNTYSYAINSNTSTICGTAPTQTSSQMSTQGIFISSRPYNVASTCASPAKIVIKLPKDLKAVNKFFYTDAARTLGLGLDFMVPGSTSMQGLNAKDYNSSNGLLVLDAGGINNGASTIRYFVASDSSTVTSGYLRFYGSTTPSITSIPQIGNNYTPGIGDLKSETFFVRYSGSGGGSSVCSTGDCVLVQKGNGVSRIQFSSTGVYILTPTRKYLDMYCTASVAGATNYLGSQINEYNSVAGTINFQSGVNTTSTNSFGTVSCIGFY